MTILVTGGAGFIGSHLCKYFLKKGYQVICVDNLVTGSRENLQSIMEEKSFSFIHHDISRPLYISQNIDFILHFASIASPKYYLNYPIKTLKSGLLGTYNCLGLAKEKKATFLLASTSEVYGDPLVHPQNEQYWGNVNPYGARSCYDESKRAAEALVYSYHHKHKLSTRVVRIFNTYGENMQVDDGRVVSNFITQALRNKDITVYGEGNQTRCFCYIDDLIEGIVKMLEVDYSLPINLGNPQEFTILELAKIIIQLTKSSSRIVNMPLPEDDPRRRKPAIERAKKILGWQPRVSLEEGLKKTIEYFKKKLKYAD